MKFRTEVELPSSIKKIELQDKIFSIGSCFATEIDQLLSQGQLQTLNNPYGTLFNPVSINKEIQELASKKIYAEEDIISYRDEFISLDHHSSFNGRNLTEVLKNINQNIELGNKFLKESEWVIVTYGTSFIYEFLPKQKSVANCHKIPSKFFNKRLLTATEIQQSIQETLQCIKKIAKENVQILFSISPVRHAKEGFVENNLSKSLLISAVHEVIKNENQCHYLPIYEIMMDDLREYRFYKEDMLHPNQQAVNYIFDKFKKAYFSEETLDFVNENFKINQALQHKTSDKNHPKYIEFMKNLSQKINLQQQKVAHTIFANSLS